MNKFILGAFALILSIPSATQAATVILPNLYAKEFCELRELGATIDSAMEAAVEASAIDGEEPAKVVIGGESYGSDVVAAYRAVMSRCPNLVE